MTFFFLCRQKIVHQIFFKKHFKMDFNLDQISEMILTYAPKVLGALLTLVIGFWVIARISRMLSRTLKKRDVDPTVRPFMVSVVSIGLKVLLLLSAASMFGLQVTSFIAIFSALAFAVGLALQGNLAHMAAGILVLTFKPYRVGDFIVAQGYSGTVKEIQIFNTILTTLDNRIIIMPNGIVISGPIENLTMPGERKVDLTFGIGYGDDIDKAREVIRQVIEGNDTILKDKGYDILVKELANSSVNFAVRVWVNVADYWDVYFYMHEQVKKQFDANQVGIPFPQMDVHMHSVNALPTPPPAQAQ